MDDRKKFFVNYDYRSNSSENFLKFDSIDFEIHFYIHTFLHTFWVMRFTNSDSIKKYVIL